MGEKIEGGGLLDTSDEAYLGRYKARQRNRARRRLPDISDETETAFDLKDALLKPPSWQTQVRVLIASLKSIAVNLKGAFKVPKAPKS